MLWVRARVRARVCECVRVSVCVCICLSVCLSVCVGRSCPPYLSSPVVPLLLASVSSASPLVSAGRDRSVVCYGSLGRSFSNCASDCGGRPCCSSSRLLAASSGGCYCSSAAYRSGRHGRPRPCLRPPGCPPIRPPARPLLPPPDVSGLFFSSRGGRADGRDRTPQALAAATAAA